MLKNKEMVKCVYNFYLSSTKCRTATRHNCKM